jgi:hypothetical protein
MPGLGIILFDAFKGQGALDIEIDGIYRNKGITSFLDKV